MRVAGYLRLSRDEDRESYSSILAQKSIIEECARLNGWREVLFYEDDNHSGYTFDRPAFNEMQKALESGNIDVIIAKDLSRIGRHNAYTLLFVDRVRQLGKRLVLPKEGEGYDTSKDDNDLLGIKTWYNEMYVKDISRKIKSSIKAKQKEGRMIVKESFGYQRHSDDKHELEIDYEAAEIVKRIFSLYLSGLGYRKIAEQLAAEDVPTPSMYQRRRYQQHMQFFGTVSTQWNSSAIQRILKDDLYIGTLRLGKTEKNTIKGRSHYKPREEQFVFENHHPPIVTKEEFEQVQSMISKRRKTGDKGAASMEHLFSGLLYCGDCGSYMIAYSRKDRPKCYICGTYHKYGKKGCSRHSIAESTLISLIREYLRIMAEDLGEDLKKLRITADNSHIDSNVFLLEQLKRERLQLMDKHKLLIAQKVAELTAIKDSEHQSIVRQSFQELQTDLESRLMYIVKRIGELEGLQKHSRQEDKSDGQLLLWELLQKQELGKKDVEILVERIIMDRDGKITIFFQGAHGTICSAIREGVN